MRSNWRNDTCLNGAGVTHEHAGNHHKGMIAAPLPSKGIAASEGAGGCACEHGDQKATLLRSAEMR